MHLRNSWRLEPDTLDIAVHEPRAEIGRGLAYYTQDKVQLFTPQTGIIYLLVRKTTTLAILAPVPI